MTTSGDNANPGEGDQRPHGASCGPPAPGNARLQELEALEALSAAQAIALHALVEGTTVTRAAELAGVNERTLRRWASGDEAFRGALRLLRRGRLEAFLDQMGSNARLAAERLAEILDADANVESKDRIAAIRLAIEGYHKAHTATAVDERLDEVERRLAAQLGGSHGP